MKKEGIDLKIISDSYQRPDSNNFSKGSFFSQNTFKFFLTPTRKDYEGLTI